jgi:hypothetical protein
MKKTVKKLALNRETILSLAESSYADVKGGLEYQDRRIDPTLASSCILTYTCNTWCDNC